MGSEMCIRDRVEAAQRWFDVRMPSSINVDSASSNTLLKRPCRIASKSGESRLFMAIFGWALPRSAQVKAESFWQQPMLRFPLSIHFAISVFAIAKDWMVRVIQVTPNLMPTSGYRTCQHQRCTSLVWISATVVVCLCSKPKLSLCLSVYLALILNGTFDGRQGWAGMSEK